MNEPPIPLLELHTPREIRAELERVGADSSLEEKVARVVARAHQLVAEGVDVIDLGGESTHPSATPVPLEIEMQRVLPAVRALRSELKIPLSIDTSKAAVADAALNAGADMVNDVTG